MVELRYRAALLSTAGTLSDLLARLGAGCGSFGFPFAIGVVELRYRAALLSTAGTLFDLLALCGAGCGSLDFPFTIGVAGCCDLTGFFLVTFALSYLLACLGAGSRSSDFPFTVCVLVGRRSREMEYSSHYRSSDGEHNKHNNCKGFHCYLLYIKLF